MQDPGDLFIAELEKRDGAIANVLRHRDSVARLLEMLPARLPTDVIANNVASHEIWELAGRYYMVTGRLHEALAVFWALYEQMLEAQSQSKKRLHKGMPLVWMADCYVGLGFAVHAKRYLMLTLCEDALRESGSVNPETTGIYFRLVWAHGLSHTEIARYASEFYRLSGISPERAFFPEALLQELDDDWMTEYPSPREASYYRVNNRYVQFLMSELGRSAG